MPFRPLAIALLFTAIIGQVGCQRPDKEKEESQGQLPQHGAWLEIHRGDGSAWRAGTSLTFAELASPPHEGEAAILNPPGKEIYATALFLGRSGEADRWQVTITPPATGPIIREIEYRDSLHLIWSDDAHSVFFCPPDKQPEPGQPVDWDRQESPES